MPQVHPQVVEALEGERTFDKYESLVVLETSTIAAIVRATDAAAKGAMVEVAELRIGQRPRRSRLRDPHRRADRRRSGGRNRHAQSSPAET